MTLLAALKVEDEDGEGDDNFSSAADDDGYGGGGHGGAGGGACGAQCDQVGDYGDDVEARED